jgi:hypothetical protein
MLGMRERMRKLCEEQPEREDWRDLWILIRRQSGEPEESIFAGSEDTAESEERAASAEEQTEEEETIIASWQSGKEPMQIGPYLKAGTSYRLEESAAVEGVYTAADVYFTTETYDPMSDADVNIIMIDAAVRLGALKSDESGSPLPGAKLGLYDPEGTLLHEWISEKRIEDLSSYVKGDGTYVLKEISAPQGYALCDPLVFTVKGNSAKNQLLRMIDRNVRIHLSVHKTDSVPYPVPYPVEKEVPRERGLLETLLLACGILYLGKKLILFIYQKIKKKYLRK